MFLNLLLSALLVSAKVIDATPSKCCGSKQVGEHKYVLQDTDANVPNNCKDSCAYSRVDEKGSMYCFGDGGDEPVTCEGEMANALYSSGAFSSGDCPIDENVKIIDADSTSNTSQNSAKECQDFCTSICSANADNETLPCECQVWTWDSVNLVCYTYIDEFYNATTAIGFSTGGPCFNPDDQIKDLPPDFFTSRTRYRRFGRVGNLITARRWFSDYYLARQGKDITKITVYTGKYIGREAVTGIEVEYGGLPGPVHGNTGTDTHVITLGEGNDNFFTGVFGRTFFQRGYFSVIYRLGFFDLNSEAAFGSERYGTPFRYNLGRSGFKLAYITGTETNDVPAMLGSVNFYFKRF